MLERVRREIDDLVQLFGAKRAELKRAISEE